MKDFPFAISRSLASLLLAVSFAPAGFSQAADESPIAAELQAWTENFKPGPRAVPYEQTFFFSPEESRQRLNVAEGFAVELVAHEPVVRQPIDMRFDERGRLWVVQYIQYPFPAGLKVIAYDQYLRAEFDGVPPPPPHHVRGADKITILEDTTGDGFFDSSKDFVTGLNLASSIALDHDGVWVLQSPYLLFYPDRNRDDIPDGDPEVHLSGFGIEDTHSVATSLTWGPDGWLYGATGSTTTLDIQGIELRGQGIWRYHPKTRKFEVFAEGGGNTVSFAMDKYGRAFSGTNNVGTRGPHYVQGALYNKQWFKHGPAINPFAFGFFQHMDHEGYIPRFAQAFNIYEGGLFPELEGQIIAGMAITNRVQASRLIPDGSTFRTQDTISLIESDDKAFRPVDVEIGPDGCIYLADWHDLRISHLNPNDTWNKDVGRIFRIVPENFQRPAAFDLRQLPDGALIELLGHPNRWHREQARRLLVQRPGNLSPALRQIIARDSGDPALEALWVLYQREEFDDALARETLRHVNPHVRRWTVRLLGERGSVPAELAADLAALAGNEPDVEVRSQLASTARLLPAAAALPIVRRLLSRDEDLHDKHLPMLLWWAIESKADGDRDAVVAMLQDPGVWRTPIFSEHIVHRLGKRYTADQGPDRYLTLTQGRYSDWLTNRSPEHLYRNLETGARLLAVAPAPEFADKLVAGMSEGLSGLRYTVERRGSDGSYYLSVTRVNDGSGTPVAEVPPSLRRAIERLWASRPHTPALITLAARVGHPEAVPAAVAAVQRGGFDAEEERQFIDLFSAMSIPATLPLIAERLQRERNVQRQEELLAALGGFESTEAAEVLLDALPGLHLRLRSRGYQMLSQRPSWARVMLRRVDEGRFDPGILSEADLAAMRGHGDPEISRLLARYEQRRTADPVEQEAARLFVEGRTVYSQSCLPCHQADGQGHPGIAPSLVTSTWVQQGPEAMARIVLHGKENPGRGLVMPSMGFLSDEQIAAALVYTMREFGNRPGFVAPSRVGEIRSATSERQGFWSDEELAGFRE